MKNKLKAIFELDQALSLCTKRAARRNELDDLHGIFSKIRYLFELVDNLKIFPNDKYDELAHIVDKWRCYLGYYNEVVKLPSLRLDYEPDKQCNAKDKTKQFERKGHIIEGVVIGDKNDKTIRIECTMIVKHPKYGKYYKRKKNRQVHDEHNSCKIGDRILAIECRPISKTKHYRYLFHIGPIGPNDRIDITVPLYAA